MTLQQERYQGLSREIKRGGDDQLKNLIQQINELKDSKTKNDAIENVFLDEANNALNEQLKQILENQDKATLEIIVSEVGRIYNHSDEFNLSQDVKDSLGALLNFLTVILSQKNQSSTVEQQETVLDTQKQSFEKFEDMIVNDKLDRLNTLKKKEMEDVLNFVNDAANKELVYDLYKSMKKAEKSLPDNFRHTDRKNFSQVKDAINRNYGKDFDLNYAFEGIQNSQSLSQLAGIYLRRQDWRGERLALNEQLNIGQDQQFGNKDFIDKFNEINDKRISTNDEIVNNINLQITEDQMKNFSLDASGNLNYDGQPFTQEKMGQLFSNAINTEFSKCDFIGSERFDAVTKIYGNVSAKIKESLGNQTETNQEISGDQRAMSNADFNAMNNLLKEKMFIEITDGKISYSSQKAKEYLSTLKSTERKDLKSKFGTPEGRAWVSAVQILLNSEKPEGTKLKVDGKFGKDTRDRVKVFQKEYNKRKPDGAVDLNEDGLPGKNTITVLLDGSIGDTKLEGQWHIDKNGIVFDDGTEIKEEAGRKYIEKQNEKGNIVKYYEYKDGMNGLGYKSGITSNHEGYLYMGNFVDGKYEGQGTITWADGTKYEGGWKENKREGQGTYTWADRAKYEGGWKENKREGQGTMTWANGNKYVGLYENDKRTEGTFILNPGDNEVRYGVDTMDGKSVIISGPEGDNNIGKYVSYGEIVDQWPDS